MAFYRRPSPLELTYIAQDSTLVSPVVNQYLIEGDGHVSLEALAQAVKIAALAFPDCRLRLKGYGAWRAWHDDGALPGVFEVDGSRWDGLSGDGAPCLGAPLNVRTGPVCEVVLVRGTPLRILFRTHHGVTDGAGTLFFMRQVFAALRDTPVQRPELHVTEWEVASGQPTVSKLVTLGDCEPVFRNATLAWEPGCHWRRFTLDSTPAGIGGKIMAVVARWGRETDISRLVFRMPSDLRRYLPDKAFSSANCSSALDLDVPLDADHKKMQQAIVSAMRNKQDLATLVPALRFLKWLPLAMLRPTDKLKRRIHALGLYNYTCTVTNLGRIDPATLSTADFQCRTMFGVPIPLELTPLYIAFVQVGTSMSMHVAIPRAVGTREDLEELCRRLSRDLSEL